MRLLGYSISLRNPIVAYRLPSKAWGCLSTTCPNNRLMRLTDDGLCPYCGHPLRRLLKVRP